MPDIVVKDASGRALRLWDFRQKTHVTLIYDPAASAESRRALEADIAAREKTWTWLALKIFVVSEMPAEFPAGVYLIDRYAHLANVVTDLSNLWEKIEKEYIYLEARQC